MTDVLFILDLFFCLTALLYMWTAIMRDLAQIRAAQKIECESIVRLAKLLDKEKNNDEKI